MIFKRRSRYQEVIAYLYLVSTDTCLLALFMRNTHELKIESCKAYDKSLFISRSYDGLIESIFPVVAFGTEIFAVAEGKLLPFSGVAG